MRYIYGKNTVLESLKSKRSIAKIILSSNLSGNYVNEVKKLANQNNIKISIVNPSRLEKIVSNSHHQGIAAAIQEMTSCSLEQIIKDAKQAKYPIILILDSIQDPQNIGAILRSSECAGVKNIIITKHQSAPINETVEKIASGALNFLNICEIVNLQNSIKTLKEEGFWIFGSSLGENVKDFDNLDYKLPLALIVGNEQKGIRKLTADKCDFLVQIPMLGKIQSLNVSVATGVLLFEINRQRK